MSLRFVYLAILAVCVLLSGFFSGSETALIGIGRERVRQMQGTGRRGARVADLSADPDTLLSTLLVANNLVNILGASVATVLFVDLYGEDWGPWVSTLVVTAVILVVGEITPKTLATRHPEGFSLAVAPTIWRLSRVLGPVARFFLRMTRLLLRLVGIRGPGGPGAVTEADILAMTAMGEEEGEIERAERDIIHSLFGLADRPVKEVMTPRIDITTLTVPVTMKSVRAAVSGTGHSRFPVTAGDLDHLVGVLYVKDLLQHSLDPSSDEIRNMLRPPYFIPESSSILQVIQQMRRRRIAFGLVLDEHGGIEGVVTVKDLVSELVGELQDEYDPGSPTAVRIAEGQWLADGRLPIEDLGTTIERPIPVGPYSTVAGWFMAVSGRIPQEGDIVAADGITLTVLSMDRNRIDRLRVEVVAGLEP